MRTETLVVGGGPAGLAVSTLLTRAGHDHVVLEQGRVGESWRSQRWDSFHLNTPNWMNRLPGAFPAENPEGFARRDELVASLERYVRHHGLPVRELTPARSVQRTPGGGYVAITSGGVIESANVIAASGAQRVPRIPSVAAALPARVNQLHASEYRRPGALPDGRILVVGSGQSGVQIAEDLLSAGREVCIATSRVGRVPRRYRGRDVTEWLQEMCHYEQRAEELSDEATLGAAQPQISGVNGGHTVSLQQLARDGAMLLGRLEGARGERLAFGDGLAENIEFADRASTRIKDLIDAHISRQRVPAAPREPDPAETPLEAIDARRSLGLRDAGITTVIWCTGFGSDFSWLRLPILDERGRPRHREGVTASAGLFVLGLPWQSSRKSAILHGVAADARAIAERVLARSSARAAA